MSEEKTSEVKGEEQGEETDEIREDPPEEEEAEVEKPKHRGPPRPRAPRRGAAPPRPRSKNADTPKQTPVADPSSDAPIDRHLPGSKGGEADESYATNTEIESPRKSKKTGPVRSGNIESATEARVPSPRRGEVSPPPEPEHSEVSGDNPMDPMSDVVPGSSAEKKRPLEGGGSPPSPAPVQRRIAGSVPTPGSSPSAPKSALKEDVKPSEVKRPAAKKEQVGGQRGPRNIPKWAAVLAGVLILLGFVYFILPSGVEIFSPQLARKIRQFTRFQFDQLGGPVRRDSTQDFQINESTVSITPSSTTNTISYVTGSIQNISSSDYKGVEVKIELYDAGGTLLDHTMDYTNQLGANQTWSFNAACPLTNAASAKVVSVIGESN